VVDVFEEVEGEIRAEHYKRLGFRLLPWAIGLVVGVIAIGGGYIAYDTWKTRKAESSAAAYDAALQQLSAGDLEGAFNALGQVAAESNAIYASFALTQQGAIRLEQGQPEAAAGLFEQSAEAAPKTAEGLLFADQARLKSAWAVLETEPYEQIEARLTPLTDPERPYSASARETLALARLLDGQVDAARSDFVSLSIAPGAPQLITQRARSMADFIDSGGAENLQALVGAMRDLPPPTAAPSGITPEQLQELLGAAQAQGAQQ
jgi:hypothetical protein